MRCTIGAPLLLFHIFTADLCYHISRYFFFIVLLVTSNHATSTCHYNILVTSNPATARKRQNKIDAPTRH
jgi:hypothetical protein